MAHLALLLVRPSLAPAGGHRDVGAWVARPAARRAIYAAVTVAVYVAAVWLAAAQARMKGSAFNLALSDGRGYYVYLPSLVIDGDLDFANQIRDHWDEDFSPDLLARRTPRGYVVNKYPAGLAMSVAPAYLAAHAASTILHTTTGSTLFAPDGYSLLYQTLSLAMILALGGFGMALADDLAVSHLGLDPRAALAAVLTYWLGTPYAWYALREPFMVHVVSAFWVTLVVWLVAGGMRDAGRTTAERPRGAEWLRWWRPLAIAFALSMAVVCRPTNGFLLPVLGLLAVRLWQNGLLSRAARLAPLAAIGALPVLLQLWIWHRTSGRLFYYSYGDEGFRWAGPALWQTLFSTRHGLFVWSPLLLLSAAGLAWHLLRGHRPRRDAVADDTGTGDARATTDVRPTADARALLLCLIASAGLLWYVNSAWHCWWFGWAFGARAFLELSVLFVVGLACLFDRLRGCRATTRRCLVYATAVALAYNYGLMAAYTMRWVPPDGYWF